jgi:hypothetical protein
MFRVVAASPNPTGSMPATSYRLIAAAFIVAACSSPAAAQGALPTPDQQIAAAVLPLPKEMRDGAAVLGYRTANKLETLRPGTNAMICLALFAVEPTFHVACYHKGLEPFMARGRTLRTEGVKGDQVDSVRFREVRDGKLVMPKQGALYQLFGTKTSWNRATGAVTDAKTLMVMYMPGATAESTGLSSIPVQTGPWMMYSGTPKAHIMISGSMSP